MPSQNEKPTQLQDFFKWEDLCGRYRAGAITVAEHFGQCNDDKAFEMFMMGEEYFRQNSHLWAYNFPLKRSPIFLVYHGEGEPGPSIIRRAEIPQPFPLNEHADYLEECRDFTFAYRRSQLWTLHNNVMAAVADLVIARTNLIKRLACDG